MSSDVPMCIAYSLNVCKKYAVVQVKKSINNVNCRGNLVSFPDIWSKGRGIRCVLVSQHSESYYSLWTSSGH